MKKSEFKKMLRKENHPITRGITFELIFSIVFISLLIIMMILETKDILPSTKMLMFDFILIIIALPYWIIDLKRDKEIRKLYEHYQKEKEILPVKDNSKILKIILIIETICVLIIGGVIMTQSIPAKDKTSIEQKEPYKTKLKDDRVIQLEEYDFDNNNFSLKVPVDFIAMDKEMIKKKYPNGNPPSFVLSNEQTTINIVIGKTDSSLRNSQVKEYLNLMKKQLSETSEIIDSSFFERDGHEVGEIKFTSPAADTDIYNHMIVFSANEKLRIVSFNCTKELQENWQNAGEYIIDSIAFK